MQPTVFGSLLLAGGPLLGMLFFFSSSFLFFLSFFSFSLLSVLAEPECTHHSLPILLGLDLPALSPSSFHLSPSSFHLSVFPLLCFISWLGSPFFLHFTSWMGLGTELQESRIPIFFYAYIGPNLTWPSRLELGQG